MKDSELERMVRYLKGESGDEEQKQMDVWLQDGSNRRRLEQIKAMWKASGDVYQSYSPNLKKAWQNIETGISQKQQFRSVSFRTWKWAGRVAAVLVATVSIMWIVIHTGFDHKTLTTGLLKELTTGSTIDSILLSDGSVIWLNRQTTVRFPETFAGEERRVFLSGEAFFKVARDVERPFIVEAQGTVTRVLGTSFNIKTDKDKASIAVLTGKVSFSEKEDADNSALLIKGEQARFDQTHRLLTKFRIEDPNLLAWKTGILVFNNTPLPEVANVLSGYYHKPITIDTPNPELLTLSASFEKQNIEEILEVVSMTLDLRCEKAAEGYILKK
jgi:ferric-dicitrate binding protein FerR (iron transport regulator)